MIGWIVGGLLTAVVAGMIYYTVSGMIQKQNLRNVMQKEEIKNAVVELINRTTNEVTLKDLLSEKRVQISGEGIASDIKERELITG